MDADAGGERQSLMAVPRPNEFPAKELSFRSNISTASNSKRWEDSMEQVMRPVGVVEEVVVDEVVEPSVAGISWAAVLAGAIASCAFALSRDPLTADPSACRKPLILFATFTVAL